MAVEGGTSARSGFALIVLGRHRPGLGPDADGQERLLAAIARDFGRTPGSRERAENAPAMAEQHRSLVRAHRSEIGRYR